MNKYKPHGYYRLATNWLVTLFSERLFFWMVLVFVLYFCKVLLFSIFEFLNPTWKPWDAQWHLFVFWSVMWYFCVGQPLDDLNCSVMFKVREFCVLIFQEMWNLDQLKSHDYENTALRAFWERKKKEFEAKHCLKLNSDKSWEGSRTNVFVRSKSRNRCQ